MAWDTQVRMVFARSLGVLRRSSVTVLMHVEMLIRSIVVKRVLSSVQVSFVELDHLTLLFSTESRTRFVAVPRTCQKDKKNPKPTLTMETCCNKDTCHNYLLTWKSRGSSLPKDVIRATLLDIVTFETRLIIRQFPVPRRWASRELGVVSRQIRVEVEVSLD